MINVQWRSALDLLLALVATLLTACSPNPAAAPEPAQIKGGLRGGNVVVIVIDALRADHVGAYGYDRDTTPFIDSLADRGILFENAMSAAPYTPQSISALMSGLYPSHRGQTGIWAMPPTDRKVMPQHFAEAGYRTGMATDQLMVFSFTKYFQESLLTPQNGEAWTGDKVTEQALALSEKFGDDPFFLYVHYIDPHALYTPPEEYYEKFQTNPIPREEQLSSFLWPFEYEDMLRKGVIPGNPGFDDMVRRYDAEIAMTDRYVQTLVDTLRSRGQLENALVIVTSDHGEEFFEHEFVQHSWTLFNESIHVPLIVWSPAIESPSRVATRVSLVDVLPSLFDLYGMSYDPVDFDGRSLFTRDGDGHRAAPESRPVIAEFIVYEKTVQRAIFFEDFKFYGSTLWWDPAERSAIDSSLLERAAAISDGRTKAPPLWHPWQKSMLFDLKNDPRERANVAASHPDRVRLFEQMLDRYRRRVEPGSPDSARNLGNLVDSLNPEQIERLKALGYL